MLKRSVSIVGYHHTFAGREPIIFDDVRRAELT